MKNLTYLFFCVLGVSACTSVKNPVLAAKVDRIRVGTITVGTANAKEIAATLQPSRFKENVAQSVLILAGGVLAGSIGGAQGVNNFIAIDAGARAGAGPRPVVDTKEPTAKEFALQSRILELSGQYQAAALEKALRGYALTGHRLGAKADWRLDCRVNYASHDVRKKHQYLIIGAEAKLCGPNGEVVWEDYIYGESDSDYGGPMAVAVSNAENLLVPENLASHVKAANAYLALSIAETLASALKWKE